MIRILKPSLDDAIFEGNPVLRGVIHNEDLQILRIDTAYQRELLATSTRRNIIAALNAKQRLPDLELGMRGDKFQILGSGGDELIILLDPVFIIDGQQRRGSIVEYLRRFPEFPVRQGVIIHFNTAVDWEKKRFEALNLHQKRVSSNVLVRNWRNDNEAVATLYGLSTSDRDFVLYDRVCWQQSPAAMHLLGATGLLRYSLYLHSHLAPTRTNEMPSLNTMSQRLVRVVGISRFRQNTVNFWLTVDAIWGVRALRNKGSAQMKSGFLHALIDVFVQHLDFWKGSEFVLPYDIKKKLKLFDLNDPAVASLAGGHGMASSALTFMIIQHINSGRRTGLLRPRRPVMDEFAAAGRADEGGDDPLPMAASGVDYT